MRRAYIIKSRVKKTDGLLLVQSYSPALFAQGVIPGPDLLLKRQRGDLKTSELQRAWEKVTEAEESETSLSDWPRCMQLPCRWCSITNGKEWKRPLKAFMSNGTSLTEIYDRCIKQGEDMTCLRCRQMHTKKVEPNSTTILCDGCENMLQKSMF